MRVSTSIQRAILLLGTVVSLGAGAPTSTDLIPRADNSSVLSLAVQATGGNASSPLMYGLFFEDINYSGDGGIYAELIRNRAFQGSRNFTSHQASTKADLTGYRAIGAATLSLTTTNPLSSALKTVLRVDVPVGATGKVGFLNEGWWGMSITAGFEYKASWYMSGNYSGGVDAEIKSSLTADSWASKTVPVSQAASDGWKQYTTSLIPTTSAPNVNNTFSLTFDAAAVAGSSLYFDLVSLFPPTINKRPNGLRPDVFFALAGIGTTWLRFPGGNNMEGNSGGEQWRWNETIGPLKGRPGRLGVWGYENTDGLGLIEYMLWANDMGLEPILGVFAGFYLNGQVIPQSNLTYYVDDVMHELEFLMGPATSTYGAIRASLGYPNPFKIRAVEIGNEDNLWGGLTSYNNYRFSAFYNAIRAVYPNLTLVSSTTELKNKPPGVWLDYHTYNRPSGIIRQFGIFDHSSRANPVLVGEYAVMQANAPDLNPGVCWSCPQLVYPTMISSAAEAVFLLGCERNADVVVGTAYGSLIQNYNFNSGTVAVAKFTADPAQTFRSVNWFVQWMFAMHLGTTTLPVSASGGFGPVYWVAKRDDPSGKYFVKLAHYNDKVEAAAVAVEIAVPGTAQEATLIELWDKDPNAYNGLGNERIKPKFRTVRRGDNGSFRFTMEVFEVAVLVVG